MAKFHEDKWFLTKLEEIYWSWYLTCLRLEHMRAFIRKNYRMWSGVARHAKFSQNMPSMMKLKVKNLGPAALQIFLSIKSGIGLIWYFDIFKLWIYTPCSNYRLVISKLSIFRLGQIKEISCFPSQCASLLESASRNLLSFISLNLMYLALPLIVFR